MAQTEIDSFVKKFKSLWNSGFNATLNLESKLGEVEIALNCKVGRVSPPPSVPPTFFSSSPRNRSPSYFRRQARRRASRDSLNVLLESHADEDNEVNGSENSDTVNLVDDEESNVRGDNVSLSATVAEESNLAIGVEPKEANVELADDDVEEVDEEELKRDKIIEEVVISSVKPKFCESGSGRGRDKAEICRCWS